MEFIETRRFSDVLYDYLDEDSYQELQISLIERPDQGDIIPGGGGIRKLRFAELAELRDLVKEIRHG